MSEKRSTFGTRFGAVMALAGAAVGLGNIWKFPYITGENGGGAFLIIYLICIVFIGLPLMLTEFALGRKGQKNVSGTFKKLAPDTKWNYFGILAMVASFIVLSYYGTIAGWTLEYIKLFVTNSFNTLSVEQVSDTYNGFVSDPIKPVLWQIGFIFLTGSVVAAGVEKGIENYSKVLMPVLFVIIIALCVRTCTLDGGIDGLKFFFIPDFSKLKPDSILIALGHCFFSLSAGMGVLLTYGSYLGKKNDLSKTALNVGVADTLIAVLAGVIIFPAVFSFGIEPNSGPGLIFLSLPRVFSQMPFGAFWGVLFFILVSFAALTSAIAYMEVVVAFIMEEFHVSRVKATLISILGLVFFGVLSTLSFGPLKDFTLFHLSIFGVMDFLSANILLPIGGLFVCVFAGWIMKKEVLKDELTNGGSKSFKLFDVYYFLVRFVVPPVIFVILLDGLGVI